MKRRRILAVNETKNTRLYYAKSFMKYQVSILFPFSYSGMTLNQAASICDNETMELAYRIVKNIRQRDYFRLGYPMA